MRASLLPVLIATLLLAIGPALASAAPRSTTATIQRNVKQPGSYDVTLSIAAGPRRDVADVRIGASVRRRVVLRANRSQRMKLRVEVGGRKLVARVVGRRVRPTVRASVRRAKVRPPAPAPTSAAPAPGSAQQSGVAPVPLPSRLVWADEFDGPAGTLPAASHWTAQTGDGWGNGAEWQTYTASNRNASLDGAGNLAVTARREPGVGAHGYTSARLTTEGKFSFRYGRLEARMRLPRGKGLWPAFWAMGDDLGSVGWPANGELDVMEALGQDPTTWYVHSHGPDAANNDAAWGTGLHTPFDLTAGFHTYGIVWSPGSISWTMDGAVVATVTPSDLKPGARWVFDHEFHLLLSLAVGGAWPGYPDASTPFPASMLVDWIRVYQ